MNNPINASDPSGHYCVGDIEGCRDDINGNPINGSSLYLQSENKGGDDESGDSGAGNPVLDVANDIIDYYMNTGLDIMYENKCWGYGGSLPVFMNTPACLDVASNLLQDIATMFSTAGAVTTLGTTLIGCLVGEAFGCAAGYKLGLEVHVTFYNSLESAASFMSFVAAARSDLLTRDTYFTDFQDWNVGEDTRTGGATLLAGGLIMEPITDAVIDGYASGYNHGYFCGISTLLDCLMK